MRPGATLIAVASVALVPAVIAAQPTGGDLAYCRALSQIYVRYIGHDWQYGNQQMFIANNDAQVAVAKCEQGDAAGAIPVLERELRNNKFTLPPRG
jgi:hypothetical protein